MCCANLCKASCMGDCWVASDDVWVATHTLLPLAYATCTRTSLVTVLLGCYVWESVEALLPCVISENVVRKFASETRINAVVWDIAAALIGLSIAHMLKPWRAQPCPYKTLISPPPRQVVWAIVLALCSAITGWSVVAFLCGWTLLVWYACYHFGVGSTPDAVALAVWLTLIGWAHLLVSTSNDSHRLNVAFGTATIAVLQLASLWTHEESATKSVRVVNTVAYAYGGLVLHTFITLAEKISVLALHARDAYRKRVRRARQLSHFVRVHSLGVYVPLVMLQILCN